MCYNTPVSIYERKIQSDKEFMKILTLQVGDILTMKKKHPCGSEKFEVLRVGSDIRIKCLLCGRDVTVGRVKLERNIKSIETKNL